MIRELHLHRRALYIGALVAADAAAVVLVVLNVVVGASLPLPLLSMVLLVSVGVFGIPGVVDYFFSRWRGRIDDALPTFLSDVTGNVKTGFSLTRSLEMAAENDYGPLTIELKRMKAQLSWGVPFEDVVSS